MQETRSNNSSALESYTDSGFSTWGNNTSDSYNQGFSRTPTPSAEEFTGVKNSKYRFDFVVFTSSHQRCSIKKAVLKITQYSQENAFSPATLLKREYCEIFENTYFEEHLRTAASVYFVAITVETNAKFYQSS